MSKDFLKVYEYIKKDLPINSQQRNLAPTTSFCYFLNISLGTRLTEANQQSYWKWSILVWFFKNPAHDTSMY